MIKKLLGYINIHPDKNQSWLLISLVISGLLITYAHPTLVKEIISNLPAQWIAFESLAASIALPNLKVSLFLWSVCCIFDDIGWLIVYTKNKQVLKNIE